MARDEDAAASERARRACVREEDGNRRRPHVAAGKGAREQASEPSDRSSAATPRRATPCCAEPNLASLRLASPRLALPCRAAPRRPAPRRPVPRRAAPRHAERRAIRAPVSPAPRTTNHDAGSSSPRRRPPPVADARPRRAKFAAYSRQLPLAASQSVTVARRASTRGRLHSQATRAACVLSCRIVDTVTDRNRPPCCGSMHEGGFSHCGQIRSS